VNELKKLPEAEFAVMKVIWNMSPPVTTVDIMEKIGEERSWKIQTVVSLMQRLAERGFLRSEKTKKEREYFPIVKREDYYMFETKKFVEQMHTINWAEGWPKLYVGNDAYDAHTCGSVVINGGEPPRAGKGGAWFAFPHILGSWYVAEGVCLENAVLINFDEWVLEEFGIAEATEEAIDELLADCCKKGNMPAFFVIANSGRASVEKMLELYDESARAGNPAAFAIMSNRLVYDIEQSHIDAVSQSAYESNSTPIFSIGQPMVSDGKIAELFKRSLKEGSVAMFSIMLDRAAKAMNQDELDRLGRDAFEDGNVAIFSILQSRLSDNLVMEIFEISGKAGNAAFFSVTMERAIGSMEQSRIDEICEDAFNRSKMGIFSIVVQQVSGEKLLEFFIRAVKEGKTAQFSVLLHNQALDLTQDVLDEVAQIAFDKGNTGILSILQSMRY